MILKFISRMKVIYIFLLLILLVSGNSKLCAMDIVPEVVGNSIDDSIVLTFETFDTTSLPALSNPDSLKILRFGPSGSLVDSIGEDAVNILNPCTGSYEVHYRGSDNSAAKGRYLIRVYAFKGGEIRGACSGGYYVKEGNWDELDSTNDYAQAILDTLNDGFGSQLNQANLDTAKIARSVWDNDVVAQGNRTVDLSAYSGGSGAIPCSLYVFSSSDSSALQGVRVRFMNAGQNATEAMGVTNSGGLMVTSLDTATYKVWAYRAGLEFSEMPYEVSVGEPCTNDTIWGSTFDPGDPVSPELCRTYGWIYDLSGNGISGVTVMARIEKSPIRFMGTIISPFYKATVSDSVGYWQLDLLPNSVLEPSDSEYEFEIYYEPGRIARKKVTIPDQSGWELDW
jgi:hypothetical protein